jgi:hypothetical protein
MYKIGSCTLGFYVKMSTGKRGFAKEKPRGITKKMSLPQIGGADGRRKCATIFR